MPSATFTESASASDIPWREVCRARLDAQNELTTNSLTRNDGMEFETDEIYVPLGLVKRPQREKRGDDVAAERGSKLYEPPEEEAKIIEKYQIDLVCEQILKQENKQDRSKGRRTAIIGEAGAGKSTLLQKIAAWVLHNTEADVPILIALGAIANKSIYDYLKDIWLRDAAEETDAAPEEWQQTFKQILKSGRVWLLLDGADEMAVDSPLDEIAAKLREGWAQNVRVVLTCRVNVWDAGRNALEGFTTYRTLDFSYGDINTPDQVGQFITNWFKRSDPEKGKKLRAELDQLLNTRIKDLVKNPLRLALLCRAWQLGDGELPDTKAELYRQFVDAIYEWKQDKFPTKPEQRQALNQVLGELALHAIGRQSSRFRLRESFIREGIEKPHPELFQLAIDLGWLNRVGITAEKPHEDVYAFFHPTFQEYFAALAVDDWHIFLNHTPDDPTQGTYHIFEAQWKEVILLWLGRKDVPHQQKEDFMWALFEFRDGCGNFYNFRAVFLAASGLTEFKESGVIAAQVLEEVLYLAFGYFNSETKKWTTFPSLAEEAQSALLETKRYWAIKLLCNVLGYQLDKSQNKLDSWQAAWCLRQVATRKLLTDVDSFLIHLLCLLELNEIDFLFSNSWIAEVLKTIGFGNSAAIATLIKLLHASATQLRGRLVQTPQLFAGFSIQGSVMSGQTLICKNVVRLLGRIGTGSSEEVAALIDLLDSSCNADVQELVIKSFGEMAERNWKTIDDSHLGATNDLWEMTTWDLITPKWEAIAALTRLLSNSQKDSIRWCAAQNLRKIDPDNPLLTPVIIDLLYHSQNERILRDIIFYNHLNSYSKKIFIGPLSYLIRRHTNEDLRAYAACNLRQIDPDNPVVLPSLIELIRNGQDEYARYRAAQELWEIEPGNPLVIPILIELMQITRNENTFCCIIENSIDANIFKPDNRVVIDNLTAIINNCNNEVIRWKAAAGLLQLYPNNIDTIKLVINLFCNTYQEDIVNYSFPYLMEEKIIENKSEVMAVLTEKLSTSSKDIERSRCALILLKFNCVPSEALKILKEILATTQSENILKNVAESLIRIPIVEPELIDALIHLLRTSKDRNTCEWAAESLKKITPAILFPKVVKSLKNCERNATDDNNLTG